MLKSGNLGIGTTTPGYKLDVAGDAHATSFPTSSDARLKKNISQIEFLELVTRWGNESYRAVDYGRFSDVLLEGIKEQQNEIEQLKLDKNRKDREIQELKSEINEIKTFISTK